MSTLPPRRKPESGRQASGDAAGVPARRAALRLLDAVLRRGLPLESALDRAGEGLPANDRALAHALAAAVLRRLPDLDALIDSATARPLPDDAKARFALRIALAQALDLGTPGHAAIATVLPLVEGGPRRLVHGVFGALMRRPAALPEAPTLPPAVAARWRAQWGEGAVAAARAAIAAQPPLDLSLRDPGETDRWAGELGGASLAPGHVRIARGAAVSRLPGYDEGAWWVQDIAASLPARLLGAGSGHAVDLCAAPGGKTLQLAAAGWRVTALDIAAQRVARIGDNLARTGLAAELVTADALAWAPPEPADAILLDAPCSATGIFRRHPDVLHRTTPALIRERAGLQARLLARAAGWLRPGGRLVYAVCSAEREEGEAIAAAFLGSAEGFAIDPVRPDELPAAIAPDAQGWVRIMPGAPGIAGGADSFFIARFVRG